MPKELHRKLLAEARNKGLSGKRKDAYVYGNKVMQRHLEKKKATLGSAFYKHS